MDREKQFIETICRELVDRPEQVSLRAFADGGHKVLEITVADDDYGKVIGKRGRILHALRLLLSVTARGTEDRWQIRLPESHESGWHESQAREGR